MSAGTDLGGIGQHLKSAAEGLVREVAGQLDLEGVKGALTEIEKVGREGRTEAEVVTAVELTDAERQALESKLLEMFGSDLTIRFRVEPAILGGMTVRVGDKYIDGSVASRLGQLRESLVGTRSR